MRLIGVKENLSINGKAIEYLTDKLKGQQVFIKYDNIKYDDDNRLLCYMYLKNKTFVNVHLLKTGLVLLDETIIHRYYDKFKSLGIGINE